ncbi:ChrR family anti-sigma-E factor [Rhizobium tumorigenes]|uniref:ChrR family anti-sigma-E factor n=1 Tax=Rhizobium tumorigenes TaxID=2041385 RepID=A0AAF1KJL8_9HYPH|nr:ChrR family anti-sigma-E factor [Rhizobium tumorigenes]WFR98912.1 ChrR family anti-sigma-E factor [Rhizobium tumorigenes]
MSEAAQHTQGRLIVVHHLGDELLMSYAAGTLSEGWNIGVATHLSFCPGCRERLAEFETIGGYFLECEEVTPAEPVAWEDMKKRMEIPEQLPVPAPKRSDPLLPQPLLSYVDAAGGLKWRSLGSGASQMKIPTSDPSTIVRLLKIPAGKPVPEHGHRGRELTLVLAGSFGDSVSVFNRGDVELADDELTHQPAATPGEDCICLAITEAPLRFTSRILRFIQPFIGI